MIFKNNKFQTKKYNNTLIFINFDKIYIFSKSRCMAHKRYQISQSFVAINQTLMINYLSGQVAGIMGIENVKIGEFYIEN
jgi:hypothetical protein